MLMEATCECGWQCRGTEDDIVSQVQAHGWSAHGRRLGREEVLAIAREFDEDEADGKEPRPDNP